MEKNPEHEMARFWIMKLPASSEHWVGPALRAARRARSTGRTANALELRDDDQGRGAVSDATVSA